MQGIKIADMAISGSANKRRLSGMVDYNANNFYISNATDSSSKTKEKEEEKNNGKLFGGILYLLEKSGVGLVSSVEGIVDYTTSGIAKLFGADDWAEDIIETNWFGDWYSHPEEWFNPGKGWQIAGDVAGGIGTSLPAIGASFVASALTGGAASPLVAKAIIGTTAGVTAGLGAAGRATQEAYLQTGQLTGKEYGYGALTGFTEGSMEGLSSLIGLGTGQIIKSFTKTAAKEVGEAAAKQGIIKTLGKSFWGEAFEESASEFLAPYFKRATYDASASNASFGDIVYSGLIGGLSGAVMGGGGYAFNSANSFIKGNKLSGGDGANEVLDTSLYFSNYAKKNELNEGIYAEISKTRSDLVNTMLDSDNKVQSVQQKKLLGDLSRYNVQAAQSMFVAKRALNIVNNADLIAEKINSYGYKDSQGKKINITANEITEGFDPKKPSSIYKALKNNSKLRSLAVADAAGQLIIDTSKFTQSTLAGQKLASAVDLNRFVENAKPKEVEAVSKALNIDSWSGLTPEIFAQKITEFIENGGIEKSVNKNELKKSFAAVPQSEAKPVPKLINMVNDGIRRYSDENINIGVQKTGDSYVLYDYDSNYFTREMTRSEMNSILREYGKEKSNAAAMIAQTALSSDKLKTDTEISNASKVVEEIRKYQSEVKAIDDYAKANIKEYKSLSDGNKSMIRKVIREGRANNINEDDLLMLARVSAHSGVDIQFSKEENVIRNSKFEIRNGTSSTAAGGPPSPTGKAKYADGFYDAESNRIVINPEAKRTGEALLIHELDHAITNVYSKKGRKAVLTMYKMALEGIDDGIRQDIIKNYGKNMNIKDIDILNDEYNSRYAEQILTNRYTLEKLLEAEPSLKEKILSFFKGASKDYADVPKLSKAAKKYYKTYKKLFDEFSNRNAGNNEVENSKFEIRNSESDSGRRYAVVEPFTDENGNTYKNAVLLDTNFFDGLSPRNWGTKLKEYVENRSENEPFILQIADENGNKQDLTFAKKSDRVQKSGGAEHTVLAELYRTSDNLSKLSAIHIDEIIEVSEENNPYYTSENSHGWFDKNGWLHRNANVINAKTGAIYNVTVDIAKTEDGRTVLYATKGKIKRVGQAKVNSLVKRGSTPHSNSDSSISQPAEKSNSFDKKSSKRQHALPLDEDGNIPAAEVALSKKSKKTVDNSKTKAEAKAEKTLERGRKALEAEKSKLRADYRTDRVYNEQSIKKELNDSVEDFRHLPKDVRDRLVRDLFLDLNESNGAEWRKAVEIQYTVKIVDEILHNPNSGYDFASPSDRRRLNESVSKAVGDIVKAGRLSEAVKLERRLKQEAKTEATAKQRILEDIHQKLKKINDRKKKRFMSASSYKSAEFGQTIEKLTKMEWRSGFSTNIARECMKELAGWYTADNPMLFPQNKDQNSFSKTTAEYNPAIAGRLKMLSEGEGEYTVKEMQALDDVLSYFTKLVDEYDKVYIEGKWQDGAEISEKMIKKIEKQEKTGVPIAVRGLRNKWITLGGRTYMDPLSVMKLADMYGNGVFTKYYNEWMNAEINAENESKRIKEKYDGFMKSHRSYLKNAETETLDIGGAEIRKIDLISYAMTLKREQAWESIANGGVVFIDAKHKNKVTVKPIKIDKGKGYKARLETAIKAEQSKVMSLLSETDIEYMKILEEGFELAKAAKAFGDYQRLGFVNVIDGYYYPIRHAYTDHISEFKAELIATDRYANASFNKSTNEEANSAILIRSADTTFNSHVSGVSRYMYLSPVMDSFNKLYKLKVGDGSLHRTIEESKTAWRDGEKLVGFDYLQNLMLDTMGLGKNVGDDFFSGIRGASVSFALGANPKVLATQLTSLIASTNVLSYGSHLKAVGIWNADMDKYSTVAMLRNSDYTIAKAQGVVDKINTWARVFSAGISLMDRFVVYRVWAACQAEVARNGGAKVGTEANKIEAGRLLDKVILETQQNSFTSRRTEGARRGNLLVKSTQMYKSDSITNFGRAIDAWGEMNAARAMVKSGETDAQAQLDDAKKHLAKAIGSITVQAAVMLAINELNRNFHGKNDDESEEEKRNRLVIDGIGNLIGGIPVLSEAYSTLTSNYGFDTMEYSALNGFFDTVKGFNDHIGKMIDGTATERDSNRLMQDVLYTGGQLLGVPTRNMKNFAYGVVRLFDKDAAYKWDNSLYKKNYSADLNEAIANGDIDRATMIMELALNEKLGSGFSKGTINELTRLSGKGEKVTPSAISNSITVNGEEYVLDKDQYSAVKSEYNKVISSVNSFIESSYYKKLTDEQKGKVLRKVYSTYKDIAYDTVLGTGRNDKALIMSKLLPENVFNAYLSLSAFESDKDEDGKTVSGSKRAKVVAAIDTLGVSKEEKLLLICASGYSIKDGDIRGVNAAAAKTRLLKYILRLSGLSAEEKAEIAVMCGFEVKNGKILRNSLESFPTLKSAK